MWSISHLCRCSQSLRAAQSRLLAPGVRTGFNSTNVAARQLITPVRSSHNGFTSFRGMKLKDLIKSNGIVARLCSSTPKPPQKTSKVVGYWLLGCSGMVFTAVVLGMVTGYIILLYSIYYVVRVVVGHTKGK